MIMMLCFIFINLFTRFICLLLFSYQAILQKGSTATAMSKNRLEADCSLFDFPGNLYAVLFLYRWSKLNGRKSDWTAMVALVFAEPVLLEYPVVSIHKTAGEMGVCRKLCDRRSCRIYRLDQQHAQPVPHVCFLPGLFGGLLFAKRPF